MLFYIICNSMSLYLAASETSEYQLQSFPPPLQLAEGPDQDDIQFIVRLNVAVAILSILGCLFNLTLTFTIKNSQYTIVRMVVGLSIMDMLTNLMVIIQPIQLTSDALCQLESFIRYFSYVSSIAWTCCFAHCLYRAITHDNFQVLNRYLKYYFLFSTGCGLAAGIIALVFKMREIVEGVNLCVHINAIGKPDYGNWMINIIPVSMSITYCLFCYCSVMRELRKMGSRLHLELVLYPAILIICTASAISMQLYIQFNPVYSVPFAWDLLTNLLYNAQGALNGIVYGVSKRKALKCKERCCPGRFNREASASVIQSQLVTEMSDIAGAHELHVSVVEKHIMTEPPEIEEAI